MHHEQEEQVILLNMRGLPTFIKCVHFVCTKSKNTQNVRTFDKHVLQRPFLNVTLHHMLVFYIWDCIMQFKVNTYNIFKSYLLSKLYHSNWSKLSSLYSLVKSSSSPSAVTQNTKIPFCQLDGEALPVIMSPLGKFHLIETYHFTIP